jgi:hypothetical protein
MIVIDKRTLISRSVMVIRIDIHHVGEEPDQHVIRVTPGVLHTTTVCEVPTKSKSGLCSWDEALAASDARPSHHAWLPDSPSNKPPRSRVRMVWQSSYWATRFTRPHKLDMRSVQIKACHRGQNDVVFNHHRQGLPPWNLIIATTLSPPFPFEWSTFPYLPHPVTSTISL